MIGFNFVIWSLATVFIGIFDSVAYTFVSLSYRIFLLVTELDLFGGGSGGATLYDMFTKKVYLILSVVMLFIFAYQLVLLLINPDGDGAKKTSGLLKDFAISIGLIVLLPTIFKYMTVFQLHVLHDNTIGALVLGTAPNASTTSETNYGDSIAMTVLLAFYHPQGGGYETFFDTLGNFKGVDESVKDCTDAGEASEKTCKLWAEALENWNSKIEDKWIFTKINTITNDWSIRETIGEDDGSYYMWVVSTGCAVLVAWFFISYAIDLGTRAVKLGFLEIIAPIPVMFNAVPKLKKSFETWKKELIKTYIEVFARLAVVFFIVKLCTLVPEFVSIIFSESTNNVSGGFFLRSIVMVILILGLLKFAKEAPELFKALFDTGGGLFKGLNFKPGVKSRIESNDYAMKGISTATGAISGGAGAAWKRWKQAGGSKDNISLGNVLTGLSAAPRGILTGAKSGWDNSSKTLKGLKKTATSALDDAHTAEQNAYDGDLHTRFRNTYRDVANSDLTNAEGGLGTVIRNSWESNKEVYKQQKQEQADARDQRFNDSLDSFWQQLEGQGISLSERENKALSDLVGAFESAENYVKSKFDKVTEPIMKAMNDDLKKIYSGQAVIKTVGVDSNGKPIEQTFTTEKAIKDFYKPTLTATKGNALDAIESNALATNYKKFEKIMRNSQIDKNTMDRINAKISKNTNGAITNFADLVNRANTIKNITTDAEKTEFISIMDTMSDVKKLMKQAKDTSELLNRTEQQAKDSAKDDKKK